MTFWLDAHLDPDLAPWLSVTFGISVKTLREIGLRDAADVELFNAGRRLAPVVIVTFDHDFVELVEQRGAPPQVLWLRLANLPTVQLQQYLRQSFPSAVDLLAAGNPLVEISRRA